jgi:hypothetical protein
VRIGWVPRDDALVIRLDGRDVARLLAPDVATSDGTRQPLQRDGSGHAYSGAGWRVVEEIREVVPGLLRFDRSWRNEEAEAREAGFALEIEPMHAPERTVIPAVSYDGNQWGGGSEPKGHALDGVPWTFASDRCAIPSATISAGEGLALALFVDESPAARDSACAFVPDGDSVRHRLVWPGVERPKVYISRDRYVPTTDRWICVRPGETFTTRAYVAVATDVHGVLDIAWDLFRRDLPLLHAPQQVWDLGIRFARDSLWVDDDEFTGFNVGLMLKDGKWIQRPTYRYEIGWAGQNASLAHALIRHGVRDQDEDSLRKGFAVLDFWANHTRFPSGLCCVIYDQMLAGRGDEAVADVCNLGYAAWQMIEAAVYARQIGIPRPDWLEMGLDVCDFFVEHQLPDGRFGRAWNLRGQLVADGGTVGCFLLLGMVTAYRHTRDERYLAAAQRGLAAYAEDIERFAATAGALDTDCIDKETAWPMLWAGVELHELTGDAGALRIAEATAYYLASWIYHHDVEWPAGTPLAELSYHTYGGTAVSAQHHHIDPWGAMLVPDLLKLAEATGRPRWRELAIATWRQSLYAVSDGSLVVNGMTIPAGGQFEGYMHTRWGGMDPEENKGHVSMWLVAWPTAFRLLALLRVKDWSVLA